MRSTAFSPKAVGMVETRSSTSRPPCSRLMRPSWGRRFSARLQPGEQLDARDHGLVDDARDHVHVVQDAVDAQPHEGQLALGLEVDVGGALLEGVAQDVVEGLDHRRRGRVQLLGLAGEELLVRQVDGRRCGWR